MALMGRNLPPITGMSLPLKNLLVGVLFVVFVSWILVRCLRYVCSLFASTESE